MKHSLLNQNQMRSNGVVVDDCPVHLSPDKISSLSIYFPEDDIGIQFEQLFCTAALEHPFV
jgi:hypothetical protein